jgi:hypothetical protein
LIHIKAIRRFPPNFVDLIKNRGNRMPADVAIIVGGVVVAFVVFAATLAWADLYSGRVKKPNAVE